MLVSRTLVKKKKTSPGTNIWQSYGLIHIGSVISVTVIYVTFTSIFHVIYMRKLKSDKQRAKHVYPVLEMLNNEVKGLKLKTIKFENLGKNPEN